MVQVRLCMHQSRCFSYTQNIEVVEDSDHMLANTWLYKMKLLNKCFDNMFIKNHTKFYLIFLKATKVSKGAKIRNRYNQVPHLAQDTNGKVTNSQ